MDDFDLVSLVERRQYLLDLALGEFEEFEGGGRERMGSSRLRRGRMH